MALITMTAGTRARAAHINSNFAECVLTSTARTVTVTHTWSASQTFTGGFTTGAAVTLGGNLLFTDATYDIGASGATRPRDFYLSRNAVVGGTLAVTGNVTLSGTGNSIGTVTTGVWNGTAVVTTYGGTGLTSYTAGDLPYYASGTALSKLGIGTSGYVLTSSGSAPQWSSSISVNTSGSAATLTTTRTIWGQNFNGSANVTGALSSVTDITFSGSISGGSTVSATTLTGTLSTAAQTNVTSVGTLTSLTTSGLGTFNVGGNQILATSDGSRGIFVRSFVGAAHYSWMMSAQNVTDTALELIPSTATGGTTFTTPVFKLTAAGVLTVTGGLTVSAGTTAVQALTATTGGFSGLITSTMTTGTVFTAASATTAHVLGNINNGSGEILWGVESSVGAILLAGTTAYDGVFGSQFNQKLRLGTNNKINITLNTDQSVTMAAGLALTGALSGVTTLSGSGAISGFTSITLTGQIKTTLTTQQLALHYDASNHLAVTVSSAGAVTYNATGASASHTFSDAVNISGLLTITPVTYLFSSSDLLPNGSGASTGTLTNAPSAGNPAKWVPIRDVAAATTYYFPVWT